MKGISLAGSEIRVTPDVNSDRLGVLTGDDEEHVVAGRAVLRPEAVDGSSQAARAGPVEVGDLNYAHDLE